MSFSLIEIFSAFMVLFAVIDITGSIPIILDIKAKGNIIDAGKVCIISFSIFIVFLFLGEGLLNIFGVDIASFAIAGSLVLFFLAMEMLLGVEIFRSNANFKNSTVVPVAFPLVAGAGAITTLLSITAEYAIINIIIALVLNIIVVFVVLKLTRKIEKLLGATGIMILRKMFGVILLAIAIKLFMSNIAITLEELLPGLVK